MQCKLSLLTIWNVLSFVRIYRLNVARFIIVAR